MEYFQPGCNYHALQKAVEELPFPLAVTAAQLLDGLERQNPIEVRTLVTNAISAAVKFCVAIAVGDMLQARSTGRHSDVVAELLLKPAGISEGDWHTILDHALKADVEEKRLIPELEAIIRRPSKLFSEGELISIYQCLDGDKSSFVKWRNAVIAHGPFQRHDLAAHDCSRWIEFLGAFYSALLPIFERWRSKSTMPDGRELDWNGYHERLNDNIHSTEHKPGGDYIPFLLFDHSTARSLSLSPILTAHTCLNCEQYIPFFFEKLSFKSNYHLSHLFENWRGHRKEHKDWNPMQPFTKMQAIAYRFERSYYNARDIAAATNNIYHNFEKLYQRPDYLVDGISAIVSSKKSGYIHVCGVAGSGKSYVSRGIEEEADLKNGQFGEIAVIRYSISNSSATSYTAFISELNHEARLKFVNLTSEIQAHVPKRIDIQKEFADFARTTMTSNGLTRLLLIIDGIDVLSEPPPQSASIADILPSPDGLPEGCFVLLTSRGTETLCPNVQANISRLKKSGVGYFSINIVPGSDQNRSFVRDYLTKRLTLTPYNDPKLIEMLLSKSEGLMRYAYHLSTSVIDGLYLAADEIPENALFFDSYLRQLHKQVGSHLYKSVYMPLLMILVAARQPVTASQIISWGIPANYLSDALINLRQFITATHDGIEWHQTLNDEGVSIGDELRYRVTDRDLVEFLMNSPLYSKELREEGHGRIARSIIRRYRSEDFSLDPADDSQLYDLRFGIYHASSSRSLQYLQEIGYNEGLFFSYLSVARIALGLDRFAIASQLIYMALKLVTVFLRNSPLSPSDIEQNVDLNALSVLILKVAKEGELEGPAIAAELLTLHTIILIGMGHHTQIASKIACAKNVCEELIKAGCEGARITLATLMLGLVDLTASLRGPDDALKLCRSSIDDLESAAKETGLDVRAITIKAYQMQMHCLAKTGNLKEVQSAHYKLVGIFAEYQAYARKSSQEVQFFADSFLLELGDIWLQHGSALQSLSLPLAAEFNFDLAIMAFDVCEKNRDSYSVRKRVIAALKSKAHCLIARKEISDAATAFRDAIAIERSLVDAGYMHHQETLKITLTNLGVAYSQLGQDDNALKCINESLEMWERSENLKTPKAMVEYARSLIYRARIEAIQSSIDEALMTIEKVSEIYSRFRIATSYQAGIRFESLVFNGEILFHKNRFRAAADIYNNAVEVYRIISGPDLSEKISYMYVLLNRCYCLIKLGEMENAGQDYALFVHLALEIIRNGHKREADQRLNTHPLKQLILSLPSTSQFNRFCVALRKSQNTCASFGTKWAVWGTIGYWKRVRFIKIFKRV